MLSRFYPFPLLAALTLAAAVCHGEPSARNWTNADGKTVNATLAGIDGASVQLRRTDSGKVFTITVASLSVDDQAYVRELRDRGFGVKAERWPAELKPMLNFTPAVVPSNEPGLWTYETPNFRFVSDVELAPSLIKEYSLTFEGTYHALKTLPLKLDPAPPGEGRYSVRLFRSRQDYIRAGGPENSGGVYIMKSQQILVPMASLGVRDQGNRVAIDRRVSDSGTLVHEITHQVMHNWMEVLPIWFVEGIAEYMSAVPMKDGQFIFRDIDRGVVEYLEQDFGLKTNSKGVFNVDVAVPGDLMSLTHEQ